MKTVAASVVAIIAACPVFACNETEIRCWKNACDHVRSIYSKCNNLHCRHALHHLEKRETRDCYVYLGMGKSTDLEKYMNLAEACENYDLFDIPN
jgi:hypothetical protein